MKRYIAKITLVVILFTSFAFSCKSNNEPTRIQFSGTAQGTYYSIIYYDTLGRNLQPEIESFFKDFNDITSLWDTNSMLVQVNRNKNMTVSPLFIDLFEKSKGVAEKTNGTFDYTVGQLTSIWGFGFAKQEKVTKKQVDSLLKFVGYEKVSLKDSKIVKKYPQIWMDFNAVAKGYSVDLIGNLLEEKGIKNYLIDVGGEVIGKGCKPNNVKWVVGIEKPAENITDERKIQSRLLLSDAAVATSGNYRKYHEVDGVRYGHTIDPKTGYPAKQSILSASVLAKECWKADAYATAFMVMGLERSIEFLKNNPQLELETFFIYYEDGAFKTFATEGFKKQLAE